MNLDLREDYICFKHEEVGSLYRTKNKLLKNMV